MTRRAAVITMIAACTLAAAGPAAAAAASPRAHLTGTPGSAVSRLLRPGTRWLRPGIRPAAAGERTMAAAVGRPDRVHRGPAVRGVLHREGPVHRDRAGHHAQREEQPDPGRAVERHQVGGAEHAHPADRRPAGRHPGGRRVLHVLARLRGRGLLLHQEQGWGCSARGGTADRWTVQPLAKQPALLPHLCGSPARGPRTAWRWACAAAGPPWPSTGTAGTGPCWPPSGTGLLGGVTCPGSGNCTAVGDAGSGKALAEHWNGKTWSVQSTASPNAFSPLIGVSCHPAGACIAVGATSANGSTQAPLAEQWTGSQMVERARRQPGRPATWPNWTRCPASRPPTAWAVGNCRAQFRQQRVDPGRAVERQRVGDREHAEPGHVRRAGLGVLHLGQPLCGGRRRTPPPGPARCAHWSRCGTAAPGRSRPRHADRELTTSRNSSAAWHEPLPGGDATPRNVFGCREVEPSRLNSFASEHGSW